ncbi:hypothetical protein D3C84_454070 [compost metagenome]
MSLGSPVTNKFQIGTAELRVGPMTSAMKLLQTHSVGLVDSCSVTIGQESVDLEGGFPKQLMDSAVVRQTAEVSTVLREYSRRNLKIAIGDGVTTAVADVATTVGTAASAAATSLTLVAGTGISGSDLVVAYKAGTPETVQILRVASVATNTLTLDASTPLLFDLAVGDPVFVAKQVAIGAVSQTNYMAAAIVQKENSSGRPLVWNFWKASISGNLEYATNASDFASTTMTLKCLQPAAAEYGVGANLAHLANIIPSHPTGFLALGGS